MSKRKNLERVIILDTSFDFDKNCSKSEPSDEGVEVKIVTERVLIFPLTIQLDDEDYALEIEEE